MKVNLNLDLVKIQKQVQIDRIQLYIDKGSKGNLDLYYAPITSLPDNLKTVGRDLDLGFSKIESLPDNLKVGGNLFLVGTSIQSLPDNLTVGGDFWLHACYDLKSLPTNLKVDGDLYLHNSFLGKNYTEEEIKKMSPGVKKVKGAKFWLLSEPKFWLL
jgi:hypothetical protein